MKGSVVTVVRRLLSAAVIVPCVAGSIALGGSAQAAATTQQGGVTQRAAGEITSPGNGQVITSGSVPVSARTTWTQLSMGLFVEGPSTPRTKVASGGANQTLSGTFSAGSAPNGTFTVTLAGEITKTVYETSTFKLRRPAAEPSGVDAGLQGGDKIRVSWSKGSEPDLQSYEIFTSQSGSLGQIPVDKACSGSSCQAVLAVPAKAQGQRVGFLVRAFRSDGDGGTLGSGSSNAAFVNIPAPPAPQATKTAQPTQQANPGKQTTGKTEDLPQLPGKDKNKVKPTVTAKPQQQTIPKDTSRLPTMPATDKQGNFTLPPADATAKDGALTPADDDTAKADEKADDTKTVETGVKAQSTESSIGNIGQYGLYVAGGLILLLLAAHGGAWARRTALATAAPAGPATAAAAPHPAPGDSGPYPSGESIPPTTTAPRRPAVVLAVAKPRKQQPSAPEPRSQQPSAGEPRQQHLSAHELRQQQLSAHEPRQQASTHESRQEAFAQEARQQVPMHELRQQALVSEARQPLPGSHEQVFVPETRHQLVREADQQQVHGYEVRQKQSGHEPPVSLPLYLSVQDVSSAESRQEPVRLALPSSAVTVVPEQVSAAVPPAVRLEDRWDDYLPPSPRSMEDSGFWERPQPGAGDFWAADDDDDAYAGRSRGDQS